MAAERPNIARFASNAQDRSRSVVEAKLAKFRGRCEEILEQLNEHLRMSSEEKKELRKLLALNQKQVEILQNELQLMQDAGMTLKFGNLQNS